MSRRRSAPSKRARILVALAAVVLTGLVSFVVTAALTAVPAAVPPTPRPRASTVVAPSPTLSLDDIARAALERTVTIEALGTGDEGLGTGWLLDTRGDFVTNAHVIAGGRTVRIRGRDGSSHVGDVVGADRLLDVAVVRSRDGFRGAPLATFGGVISAFPEPAVVIASGTATGHADITDETITGIDPDVPVTQAGGGTGLPAGADYHDMLLLDGQPIHPGNSGGPVLDGAGRVVGIVTLASRSAAEGYAIQLNRVLGELLGFAAR